ncbi:energy-coupling factor transporter transmembrane component T [Myxococcus sp. RHSTA-1-4]|uniref:CbiQ family ECF transporter T component n=1 Tax=Myxococcus sp. RHSTA-1-4 TaxID=2874601 RepID=UPI001CC0A9F3|nr:energy-coupling factor transporter transmembrane protein EcfT [Myxococcus sp. RHSTA-1-4]
MREPPLWVRVLDARLTLGFALALLAVGLGGPLPWTPLAVALSAGALGLAWGRAPARVVRGFGAALVAGGLAAALHVALGTRAGAEAGFVLGARMAAGVAVFGLFSHLTPPWVFARALRGLGVPEVFTELLALSARYARVFEGAARTAREAQLVRGGYGGMRRALGSMGALAGLTLVRAFDQACATAEARAARGLGGRP